MKNVFLKGFIKEEKEYLDRYIRVKSLEWGYKLILVDYELGVKGFGIDCYRTKIYSTKRGCKDISNIPIPVWYLQQLKDEEDKSINDFIEESTMYGLFVTKNNGKYYFNRVCSCCEKEFTQEVKLVIKGNKFNGHNGTYYCRPCLNEHFDTYENIFEKLKRCQY